MYLVIILLLMAVLPAGSVLVHYAMSADGVAVMALVGKWFVFWAIGARLLLAGLRQVLDPGFTAKSIFAIDDPATFRIVRELGFANLAIGLAGLVSLAFPAFVPAVALVGGLFLGLDGIEHLRHHERNQTETIAMASDLAIALLLAAYLGWWLLAA